MQRARRVGLLGFGAAIGLLLFAAVAWACIPVATLDVTPQQVSPGQEVTVSGVFYGAESPVVMHFNALDGPVLAELTPNDDGIINGKLTIPADTEPGNYVLVATQEAVRGETTWGVPSRALVTVIGDGGAPVLGALEAPPAARPAGLVTGESAGLGELVLVGLGVAGVGMFLAGMAAFFAGRRAAPEAVRARK
ncbi:MAG: hypothetical protein M3276_04185 [Actinomycetota bacterium]|nr:hypothetical protein [Actinomycetota bacterium]